MPAGPALDPPIGSGPANGEHSSRPRTPVLPSLALAYEVSNVGDVLTHRDLRSPRVSGWDSVQHALVVSEGGGSAFSSCEALPETGSRASHDDGAGSQPRHDVTAPILPVDLVAGSQGHGVELARMVHREGP